MSQSLQLDHGGLQLDLRNHLMKPDRVVLVELHLGSPHNEVSVGRADVFSMECRYKNLNMTIYEVKHSTSDLASDLRQMKYKRYLPYCDRLIFALGPEVSKDAEREIPDECGIMRRGPQGWKTVRKAKPHERPPFKEMAWAAMVFHLFKEQKRGTLGRLDRLIAMRQKQEKALIAENRMQIASILGGWASDLAKKERELDTLLAEGQAKAWTYIEEALGLGRSWGLDTYSLPETKALRVLNSVRDRFVWSLDRFIKKETLEVIADDTVQRQIREAQETHEKRLKEEQREVSRSKFVRG